MNAGKATAIISAGTIKEYMAGKHGISHVQIPSGVRYSCAECAVPFEHGDVMHVWVPHDSGTGPKSRTVGRCEECCEQDFEPIMHVLENA